MVEKIYKYTLSLFLAHLLFINFVTFFTTFNPKSIINPFFIKSRTISVYILLHYIITDTGVLIPLPSKEELYKIIEKHCQKYKIDPELVKIVIEVESKYKKYAISRTGAVGLMQVMPSTFYDIGFQKPFDIEQNIEAGIKYLSMQIKRFRRLDLALSAYNAGPTKVLKNMSIPKIGETEIYVKKIMEKYSKIRQDALEYNFYLLQKE
ncbi:MAG: lytic transglycosylase domain-containing protein [Calditerrivibrio sp.]|nr:lytic transglycosylase domain-containing protein [Calditerrivibrio sp.]